MAGSAVAKALTRASRAAEERPLPAAEAPGRRPRRDGLTPIGAALTIRLTRSA